MPILLGYCTSKAAGNIIMAKYSAELKGEGIKTLSLSPGWVDIASGTQTMEVFRGRANLEPFCPRPTFHARSF